jgi:RNA 3'-terminal phosphate cyclase (ATP)
MVLTLDGSTLEGGGQLVRVALSLSAIRRIPLRISKVRANRAPARSRSNNPTGGLKESHLAALQWLADMCGAKTAGDEVGSEEFLVKPTPKQGLIPGPKESTIVLKNPGSVWLILQALLPFILFSLDVQELKLTLKGGTNVDKSMSGEYVQQVLTPTLRRIGLPEIDVQVVRRGWAANAAEIGEAVVTVRRSDDRLAILPAFTIVDRGDIDKISLTILAHGKHWRTIFEASLKAQLRALLGEDIAIETAVSEDSGRDSRTYIMLVAHTTNHWRIGRDVLYSRKIKNDGEARALAERASVNVVQQLADELARGGCVDEYLQDQLVIFQALASGTSVVDAGKVDGKAYEGSLHTRTVRWVCEELLNDQICFGKEWECNGLAQNGEVQPALSGITAAFDSIRLESPREKGMESR